MFLNAQTPHFVKRKTKQLPGKSEITAAHIRYDPMEVTRVRKGETRPQTRRGSHTHTHRHTHAHDWMQVYTSLTHIRKSLPVCQAACSIQTYIHTHVRLPRPAEFTHEGPEQTATRPSPHSQTPPGWLSRGAGDALKERCWRNSITQWWRIHNLTLHRSLLFPSPVSTRTGGGEKKLICGDRLSVILISKWLS